MTVKAYVPRGRFGYWEKRFAPAPLFYDAVLPVFYLDCPDLGMVPGFVRKPTQTILIDLGQAETAIFGQCMISTRNEISRATRDGVVFRVALDYRNFLTAYEAAARYLPLPVTSATYLDSLGENLCITEAVFEDVILVTHAFIVDPSAGRVRQIRSASVFRDLEKSRQRIASRANRFLTFHDMLHFRKQGFRWHDLGGYDPPGSPVSAEHRRVSEFKESFGGRVVQEANYMAWAQECYRWGRQIAVNARVAK